MSSDSKKAFQIGDLVWAKVKGYPYWPGKVEDNQKAVKGIGKPPKNATLIYFFQAGNHGWGTPETLKSYTDYRESLAKTVKSIPLKTAVELADQEHFVKSGVQLPPLSFPSVKTPNSKAATPKAEKATPKVNAVSSKSRVSITPSATPPVQRDYSRTPFGSKKDTAKRSFEAAISTPETLTEPRKKNVAQSSGEPRVKNESSPRKRLNSSPTKATVASSLSFPDEDDVPAIGTTRLRESKAEIMQPRSGRSSLKFGFLGLGRIGKNVLTSLIDAGHDCTIWNRTPSKCKEFEKKGAIVMKTPGDVVREADITFCCLSDSDASSKIYFGNCGVHSEISPAKGYVELTSLDTQTSLDIEENVKRQGGRYLEAPLLTLLTSQDKDVKCVAMVAGDRSLFEDCNSCFQAFCSDVFYLNESAGSASKMNLVTSTLQGNIMGAFIESISLVERMNLMPKDFIDILSRSPSMAPMVKDQNFPQKFCEGPSTLVREIPFDNIRRDQTYLLSMANTFGYSTPITAAVNEHFKTKQHQFY